MTKDRKRLLAACAVLLILIAVYAALVIRDTRRSGQTEARELIFSGTADEIQAISFLAVDHTEIAFSRENGTWVLEKAGDEDPAGIRIDQDKVNVFAAGITGIAVRQVINDPEDLSEYGLDEPFTEVTVRTADGESVQLSISAASEGSGAVYCLKNGDQTAVYACAAVLKSNFEKNIDDFRIS